MFFKTIVKDLCSIIVSSAILSFCIFTQQIFSQFAASPDLPQNQVRIRTSLNQGWQFTSEDANGAERLGFDDKLWSKVNLPHTWNAEDAFDDTPGYRQGASWYRKTLELNDRWRGKRLFLHFEGVMTTADIFVNGNYVGKHVGGYSAFTFDVTDYLAFNTANVKNTIAVRVDNTSHPDVPPSPTADFNFYGGIYRDVWLIATDEIHFSTDNYGSSGVFIDTPQVSQEKAVAGFRGGITNESRRDSEVIIRNLIFDADGKMLSATENKLTVAAGKTGNFAQTSQEVKKPNLWSPDTPYLYTVKTEIFDGERLLDSIESPLGFRWFSFDADKGFFLNGKPFKLVGANRHQDYQNLGNAVPNELQVKDLEIIKQTGMNWVLLSHYPHDPEVLNAADRLGLIVWEEIPILRQIGTSPAYTENAKRMLVEMIRQHYNHPSVVFWCYMNEIFLRTRQETGYVQKTVELARQLEEIARREDPNRLTVIATNRSYDKIDLYEESGLTEIPRVVALHLYHGWYYGKTEEVGGFLDDYHRLHPSRRILISEYGADSDSRLHSNNPSIRDYTTEWAQKFHESYIEQMSKRPFLGGFGVWNAFDFGAEARGESTPHLNQKGLYTFDRKPKDIAFYYAAKFTSAPVLHIASREWNKRVGSVGETQFVKVYTNLPEVELFVSGKSAGKKKVDATRVAVWEVVLHNGNNAITVSGQTQTQKITDQTDIAFAAIPENLKDAAAAFPDLAIDVGAKTQFTDRAGIVWQPDRIYEAGGWGYVAQVPDDQSEIRIPRNVSGTADDPLYQTYRQGLTAYRFDIPDGEYEIELLFAEPSVIKAGGRVFNVAANGVTLLENFDLNKDAGLLKAVAKTFKVRTDGGKGLSLDFQTVKGETVLSGVRLRRLK